MTQQMLIAFNKPFGVLSQFTADTPKQSTLAGFKFPARVYPIGRLDLDSEGLLLLSDESALNERILHPKFGHVREYWVQVERVPTPQKLAELERGVMVQGLKTRPCQVRLLDHEPDFPPRDPPIRYRKSVDTCWISIELQEGRNRQVRRMTAAIGHPTLRLVRVRIGKFRLVDLKVGEWRELTTEERRSILAE